MSTLEDIGKLKVAELRAELLSRGLENKGVKAVLLDRLREAIENEAGSISDQAEEEEDEIQSEDVAKEKNDIEEETGKLIDGNTVEENGQTDKINDQPEESNEEPEESIKQPEESVEHPEESIEKPEESAKQPEESAKQPEESAKQPEESAKQPEEPAKQPEEPAKQPEEPIEMPEESIAQPAESVEEPQESIAEHTVESTAQSVGTEDQVQEMNGQVEAGEDLPIKEELTEADADLQKKTDYEDAPMEDLSEVKQEIKEEGSTTEPEGICSDAIKVEGGETEVKTEESPDKRGIKRPPTETYQNSYKRPRQERVIERFEDEPVIDKSVVALDWYNSDLSLVIDNKNQLSATPMVHGGFAYVWHGVRALYGVKSGKVFYEVKVEEHLNVSELEEDEMHPHVVRVGWSVDSSDLTLGEEPLSYGFGGTGKASTNLKFKDYGRTFSQGDTIGCFLDMDASPITMSFSVDGKNQGICYHINGNDLGDKALFPHILTKNCSFKVNFGSEDHWFEPMMGYKFLAEIPLDELEMGSQGPETREDCEVIMMVGLPAAGKSVWAKKYCKEHPEMNYNVIGTNNLIDRMKVMGLPRKNNYSGRWDILIERCTKCLNKMLSIGYKRRRNFIIDQTNVYPSAQRRKIKGFAGCKRRAVVLIITDEELQTRTQKREADEGKLVPDKAILEMKANFKIPEVGEFFDDVEFVELEGEKALEIVEKHNKEGKDAGYGSRQFVSSTRNLGYVDRRGKYNNRGGSSDSGGGRYRGGWDNNRDRHGSFDRRDRGGGSGGGNWNNRDRNNRGGGGGGGYNKDRRGGGAGGTSSWGGGSSGGYRGNQGKSDSWNQGNQNYNQNWGSGQGSGGSGYNQSWGQGSGSGGGGNSGYNWNQQYYGNNQQQQQQQQQPTYYQQQQNTASYNTGNQYGSSAGSYGGSGGSYSAGAGGGSSYNTSGGSGYNTAAGGATSGYNTYGSGNNQQQQQQWSGYSGQQQQQGYGSGGSSGAYGGSSYNQYRK